VDSVEVGYSVGNDERDDVCGMCEGRPVWITEYSWGFGGRIAGRRKGLRGRLGGEFCEEIWGGRDRRVEIGNVDFAQKAIASAEIVSQQIRKLKV
jgi:hypothetical protein